MYCILHFNELSRTKAVIPPSNIGVESKTIMTWSAVVDPR